MTHRFCAVFLALTVLITGTGSAAADASKPAAKAGSGALADANSCPR